MGGEGRLGGDGLLDGKGLLREGLLSGGGTAASPSDRLFAPARPSRWSGTGGVLFGRRSALSRPTAAPSPPLDLR
ncbi:hypothetical protein SLNWT_3572 [Streptomyces albus]|uniref:Uncharacterized protein n=1 Tax=Streptomyces albus (strain ATCC 21838 / DSM 41398 / FERM P-419 / JCM 4703 / NBRC 107858) TaxID=1081613 RepID=A0A0B5EN20_STRA4|nr:hypothetical protein SLNWT_3572 [Streptomyces albus]AOU78252.1 hypothetical protein SLNHY_3561 [Streptomyces albus]AYN34005.1 hypothetical protein DUI70_3504 [Streptomyces albus]